MFSAAALRRARVSLVAVARRSSSLSSSSSSSTTSIASSSAARLRPSKAAAGLVAGAAAVAVAWAATRAPGATLVRAPVHAEAASVPAEESALTPTTTKARLERWLAPEPTDAGWRQVLWLAWDWTRTWVRAGRLLVLFVPILCTAPLAVLVPRLAAPFFRLLATTLELAGPTYIKLGQWASTRPDLFPDDMCVALTTLHDQIAPHAFADTAAILSTALGRPWTEVFATVDAVPIGSGCIAQVHVGRLRPEYAGGDAETDVAIKVVHPGTEKNMRRDLRLMLFGAALLETLVPTIRWLGAVEVVERFAEVKRVRGPRG